MDYFELPPTQTIESQVLTRLREAIIEGVFEPGSQLNQAHIASQFGISRGPLRVAIGKLEEEGLLQNIPHKGTFISVLNKKTVSDLYDVRAILEGHATKLAVKNHTHQDFANLQDLLDKMQIASQQNDTSKVVWFDFAMHQSIIKLSQNTILEQIWSTIQVKVRWVLSHRHRAYHNLVEIADSHIPLLQKFEEGDSDGANKVMRDHIIDALDELIGEFEE